MAKREAISKRVRFEVFKRDSFACQYCGASAPDSILHVDHIKPVSKGGDNEIVNLVTACLDCNSGKGARELDDDAAIQKQRDQLNELNERREQLEMMLQWRDGLKGIAEEEVGAICDEFDSITHGTRCLNERGRKEAKSLLRKYGLNAVLDAMEIAADRYLEYADDGDPTPESCLEAWGKVKGICYYNSQPDHHKKLAYIRGIVRNRMYCVDWRCMKLLKDAYRAGASIEQLTDLAKSAPNWTEWQDDMQGFIDGGDDAE